LIQASEYVKHGRARGLDSRFSVVNDENTVKPFHYTDRLSASERAMLMGGACEKAYRWAPKKG
jgi:hypothetical protein